MSIPLAPLRLVSGRLAAVGVVHSLGGSGLRRALGEPCEVRDWDLTTDADTDLVHRALVGLDHRWLPPVDPWVSEAAWSVVLPGASVDVIVRFAVRSGDVVHRVPTVVTGTWEGVPTGDRERWADAMARIGR